jgi:hypothetical protein
VKPAEEEASNVFVFVIRIALRQLIFFFHYLEPVLAEADVIEPVKLVEEVVGKLFFQ